METENRRKSLFNTQISIGNLIWVVGIFVAVGVSINKFDVLEDVVGTLVKGEEHVARMGDLVIIDERLEKKITILNEHGEEITDIKIELARMEERHRFYESRIEELEELVRRNNN